MSELWRRQRAAGDAYKAAHPHVDWDTHLVVLRRNADESWEGIGHRFWPEEERAWPCCDPGNCPTHADDRGLERPLVDQAWARDWDSKQDAVYDDTMGKERP